MKYKAPIDYALLITIFTVYELTFIKKKKKPKRLEIA